MGGGHCSSHWAPGVLEGFFQMLCLKQPSWLGHLSSSLRHHAKSYWRVGSFEVTTESSLSASTPLHRACFTYLFFQPFMHPPTHHPLNRNKLSTYHLPGTGGKEPKGALMEPQSWHGVGAQ